MTDKKDALIWVVDDSKTARTLIEDTLYKSGYSNVRVFNGQNIGGKEVIDELKSGKKPDLIITDYDMPIVDGIAVAETAHEHGVKTIIFSSNPYPEIKLTASALEAEFCEKPYIGVLMDKVNNILNQNILHSEHTQGDPPAKQTPQQGLQTGV